MSLKVLCDVKSPQTTFTTGNITLERIFCKQEEKLLFFGSVSGCTCLILRDKKKSKIYKKMYKYNP